MPEENKKTKEVDQGDEGENKEVVGLGSKKKIIILLLPILLVIGAVVGVYFSGVADSFFTSTGKEEKVEKTDSGEATASGKEGKSTGIFYEVPDMLVNLSTKTPQKPVYFKIKITLELNSATDKPSVEEMLPRIIDSMQFYLREMRIEELQGSMGTYRLKEELLDRLNKVVAPTKIKDVLFKDVLIQ